MLLLFDGCLELLLFLDGLFPQQVQLEVLPFHLSLEPFDFLHKCVGFVAAGIEANAAVAGSRGGLADTGLLRHPLAYLPNGVDVLVRHLTELRFNNAQ